MGNTITRWFIGTSGGDTLYGATGQRFAEPQGNHTSLPVVRDCLL